MNARLLAQLNEHLQTIVREGGGYGGAPFYECLFMKEDANEPALIYTI